MVKRSALALKSISCIFDHSRDIPGMTNQLEQLLTPDEAAGLLNVANRRTLAFWRSKNEGPPYVAVGGLIRYRRHDLATWLDGQTKRGQS
jgi:hypothetical protein